METTATIQPKVIHLSDYSQPDFLIDDTHLHFELLPAYTEVRAVLKMRRNPESQHKAAPLVLKGEELDLQAVDLNGKLLSKDHYRVVNDELIINDVGDAFTLETIVRIKPHENTKLSGLYQSKGNYCTQCESQGFRRITYFLDRPDVMTRFTTTISADRDAYPVLLSNGNLVEERNLADNRHWVKWEDPSLKPSYLFALVAGNYQYLADTFTSRSGRKIALRVYVEPGKLDQAHHAMASLQRAMKWDEDRFGREYDLDMYMIVAVSDFNFGAMENKGLNLFNDKYVLAKPSTATDDDYLNIESVVGHEYFHNWSGNRVTCRDWFQITLKEGLTIFRDQSFTADLHSAAVKRISDVNVIRTAQFSQDAGPMAHPIRPDSYIEINNFYTVTVYNKGSEVIRMIETLIGRDKFRKGMDIYFTKYDGHAVTTEEFIKSMEEAGQIDLTQFRRWYTQAGTPVLDIQGQYNAKDKTYTLTVKQSCPPSPGQPSKENFHIPLAIGLLDSKGNDMPLQLEHEKAIGTEYTKILSIKNTVDTFKFVNVTEAPVPSLLRNFSAPVKVRYPYEDKELLLLIAHDSDGFNRWDASQQLATKIILQNIKAYQQQQSLHLPPEFIEAMRSVLKNQHLEKSFIALMLSVPRMAYLMEMMDVVDIEALHNVREFIKIELASQLRKDFLAVYQANHSAHPYKFNSEAVDQRCLKNLCLAYLAQLAQPDTIKLCVHQYQQADNMTDAMGALSALMNVDCKERSELLGQFYQRWQAEDLVIDKWFALQAMSSLPNTLQVVKQLLKHPAFTYKNPNKVRSLIGTFAHANYINFHAIDGSGYEFLADQILIMDPINPQVASRLTEALIQWRKFDSKRQQLMLAQLQRIAKAEKLSKDVYELVSKSLPKKQ